VIRLPTAEAALEAYRALAHLGVPRPVLRDGDVGILESCIQRATTTIYGTEAYPTIHDKVAAIADSVSRNHPLIDGNKRLAYVLQVMVYSANGYASAAAGSQADLFVAIARGDLGVREIAERFEALWRPLN
jgi:death-on-curing protein